jgi:hypothetical protein
MYLCKKGTPFLQRYILMVRGGFSSCRKDGTKSPMMPAGGCFENDGTLPNIFYLC